jgi:AAA+ superfamily predicted ATPase
LVTEDRPLKEQSLPRETDDVAAATPVQDLVLLRTTVENWSGVAAKAVGMFMRDDGSFWKDSKVAENEEPGAAPHITTSARAYIALLYADRLKDTNKGKRTPEWATKFEELLKTPAIGLSNNRFYEARKQRPDDEGVDPYEVNTFDIAHLADFVQVSGYLSRFYEVKTDPTTFFKAGVVKFSGDDVAAVADEKPSDETDPKASKADIAPKSVDVEAPLTDGSSATETHTEAKPAAGDAAPAAMDLIKSKLLAAIKQAGDPQEVGVGFPGEVRFEDGRPESRHYFATLHTLRALHALGETQIENLSAVVAGARSFAIEQSYYFQRGATHRQDPVRLAFAGCIYAIYDEHVDKDLCLAIIEALAGAQQENGSWPATHPVFRKHNAPWHIASHEVALCLSWLYFQPRVPDAARPLLVDMMRRYFLNGVIPTFYRAGSRTGDTSAPTGSKRDGWQDDHTVSPDTTLGWATAIVCHFLAGFTGVLNDWINRRVIEELDLQLATQRYRIDDTASSPSPRWQRDKENPFVWPDLPPHGWHLTAPDPATHKTKIEERWTDPLLDAAISDAIATKVLAPIMSNPSEQPQRDRCSGLMPGSPGTRKTSLVKQISLLSRWPMVAVPASSIFEEGFDRMEARASKVFGLLNHLRGCVIFFDEFEEFFLSRGKDEENQEEDDNLEVTETGTGDVVGGEEKDKTKGEEEDDDASYKSRTIAAFTTSAMLPRLQELHDTGRCLIFLATNYPKKLDKAIKRAGRFDFTITVNHPKIDRVLQYFTNLNQNSIGMMGLSVETPEDIEEILKAIRTAVEKVAESGAHKTMKFSIVEETIRQMKRPKDKRSLAEMATEAEELITKQITASKGGNPPELTSI